MSGYGARREKAFFDGLRSMEFTGWIRGEIMEHIFKYHPEIWRLPGVKQSMTDDIPQRPSTEQVIEFVYDYTPYSESQIVSELLKERINQTSTIDS